MDKLSAIAPEAQDKPVLAWEAVRLARLRFVLRSRAAGELRRYGESMWNGALKSAVWARAANAGEILFPSASKADPRPVPGITLSLPPGSLKLVTGTTIAIDCTLFGHAIEYAPQLTEAMLDVAESRLCKHGLRFALDGVLTVSPGKGASEHQIPMPSAARGDGADAAFTARDILTQGLPEALRGVWIRTLSRLHLQEQTAPRKSRTIRCTPQYSLLVRRAFRRICDIGSRHCDIDVPPELAATDARVADQVALVAAHMRYVPVPRKGRQDFGGLEGDALYRGALGSTAAWLAVGQWTGIGNNTAFGLGRYECSWLLAPDPAFDCSGTRSSNP